MIARIALGIIVGYLLLAYFPLLLRFLPYLIPAALIFAAFLCLRAAPVLAEPLGYGLLIVLLCYMFYLFLYYKKHSKRAGKGETKQIALPMVKIKQYPRLSALITMLLYTLALTFGLYMIILLIYVQ